MKKKNIIFLGLLFLVVIPEINYSQYELKYAGSMNVIKRSENDIIVYWRDSVLIYYDYKNIISNSAFYSQAESLLVFRGDVILEDTVNKITSDSLYVFLKDSLILSYYSVNFLCEKDSINIKAESLMYYYGKKYGKVFKNVECNYNNYLIRADSVYIFGQIDSLYFWSNVQLKKEDFLAKTDFAKIKIDSSLIKLFNKPQLVMGKSFLKGTNIDIVYKDKNIDSIIVDGYASGRILSIDSLKKDTILVYFSSRNMNIDIDLNKLKTVELLKNSEVEYEETNLKTKEKKKNKLSGYFIKIEFANDSINKIFLSKDVEGTYISSKEKEKNER